MTLDEATIQLVSCAEFCNCSARQSELGNCAMRLKAHVDFQQWINDYATSTGESENIDISRIVANLSDAHKKSLADEMAKSSGKDLDFIAELAGVPERHNGPYTLTIDEDHYKQFVASGYDCSSRYITTVEGFWGHIFDVSGREDMTMFVYDTEEDKLVDALIERNAATGEWTLANDDELADLEESLQQANPEALEHPFDWGLDYTDTLPEWVERGPALKI